MHVTFKFKTKHAAGHSHQSKPQKRQIAINVGHKNVRKLIGPHQPRPGSPKCFLASHIQYPGPPPLRWEAGPAGARYGGRFGPWCVRPRNLQPGCRPRAMLQPEIRGLSVGAGLLQIGGARAGGGGATATTLWEEDLFVQVSKVPVHRTHQPCLNLACEPVGQWRSRRPP